MDQAFPAISPRDPPPCACGVSRQTVAPTHPLRSPAPAVAQGAAPPPFLKPQNKRIRPNSIAYTPAQETDLQHAVLSDGLLAGTMAQPASRSRISDLSTKGRLQELSWREPADFTKAEQ